MVSGLLSMSSIADGIRHSIYTHTYDVFELMEFNYTVDDIVVDSCNANGQGIDALFYIKTVENVKKKYWDEAIDFILEDRRDIMLKTIKKESGKNIRFHLKYTNDEEQNPIY